MDPIRFEALWVKTEGTYGVDAVPVLTDAVRFRDRLWPTMKPRHVFPNLRRDSVSHSLLTIAPGTPRGRVVDVEIPWEVKGKGSAYVLSTDVEGDPLIQSCGMGVVVSTTGGSEKLTYTLAESGHKSCTIYGYAGGIRYIILGSRGNLIWEGKPGEDGVVKFVMTGLLVSDPATQSVPASTYDASLPPNAIGMGFSLNPGSPYTPRFGGWELNLGNEVDVVEDANGTDGLAEIRIMGRENPGPQFKCTIEKDLLATYNPEALLNSRTSHAIAMALGATQYNRFKLSVASAYITEDPGHVEYLSKRSAGWELVFDLKDVSLIFD